MSNVTLYDASGNALNAAPPRAMDFGVHGVPGLRRSGGSILEEQHERMRTWQGQERLYREMRDNSPVIGGALLAMKTWASSVPWSVDPARENDAKAARWAWFVESNMTDMSGTFDDMIWQALSMLDMGWSLFEVCYKRRMGRSADPLLRSQYSDGYVGWRKFAFRDQATLSEWDFDPATGSLRGFIQQPPVGMVRTGNVALMGRAYIPIEKCVLFRTQVNNDNPQGRSVLRNAVVPYLAVRRTEDIELIGVERDLVGMPDMQVPVDLFSSTATAAQQQALDKWCDVVSRIKRDELEGIVRPSERDRNDKPTGYKFALTTTGGERSINIDAVVRRHEARMAMSMLAEFIMVGVEKGGGLGGGTLHEDKTDAFALTLAACPRRIASVLNHFAIAPLCRINGCPEEDIPTLKHGDIAAPSLESVAAYVQALSTSGLLMYDVKLERKLREIGDLPQSEQTEPTAGAGADIAGMGDTQGQSTADEANGLGIPSTEDDSLGNVGDTQRGTA